MTTCPKCDEEIKNEQTNHAQTVVQLLTTMAKIAQIREASNEGNNSA